MHFMRPGGFLRLFWPKPVGKNVCIFTCPGGFFGSSGLSLWVIMYAFLRVPALFFAFLKKNSGQECMHFYMSRSLFCIFWPKPVSRMYAFLRVPAPLLAMLAQACVLECMHFYVSRRLFALFCFFLVSRMYAFLRVPAPLWANLA